MGKLRLRVVKKKRAQRRATEPGTEPVSIAPGQMSVAARPRGSLRISERREMGKDDIS